MPVQLLSDAERERLAQFPSAVSPDDLHAYFTLGEADYTFVYTHRGAANRLGVALQIGMLRYLGYWPDDVTQVPLPVVVYVAQQIDAPPASLAAYGQRAHTRTDHQHQIARYLGFRPADMFDLATLTMWLVERALEHDRPRLLFQLVLEKLAQDRLIRPGISVVERLVATASERAQAETFQRLDPLLTLAVQTTLDLLLVPDAQTGRTPLAWLRQGATTNTGRAILEQLEKLRYVRQWDIDAWPLDRLTPNRLKFLAQLGQKVTNQALQRMAADRRYPILVAFLWQMREALTDEIVELFDRCLAHAHSRAARDLDAFRRTAARATNEKVRLFHDLARIVLDPMVADDAVRAAIYAEVPPLHLMAAVAEAVKLLRPLDDNYFDFVAQRYSYLRTFTPALLAAFEFRSHQRNDPLLGGVALLRQLNHERRRTVPDTAPLAFVPSKWQPYVRGAGGHIDRRYYELCVLWELRHALRAGDVWLPGSRRYADPETYLIPPDRWRTLRADACALLQVPEQGTERVAHRQQELAQGLATLDQRLRHNAAVRVEQGKLVVTPLAADERPNTSVRLEQQISAALPWIELTDLLIEVDRFTNFSQHFEHVGGREPRSPQFLRHLYAAILAQACNFGLEEMAQMADLSYQRLAWCTTWYVREETLRAATTALVNAQYHQPLQRWA